MYISTLLYVNLSYMLLTLFLILSKGFVKNYQYCQFYCDNFTAYLLSMLVLYNCHI